MADLISMLAAAAGAAAGGGEVDPNFNQTVLLLHGDGTNGAQNNTFLDSSTNNFTITRNGNTTQGTFSPFSVGAGGWSNYFDGTGDYLSVPADSAFSVGTGAVTIEAWIYCASLTETNQGILSGRANTSPNFSGLGLVINNSKLTFTIMEDGSKLQDADDIPINQWVHVLGVRNGSGNAALFVNGTRKVYQASNTANGTSTAMNLGRFYPATDNFYFIGSISNARIVKGTAVYDPTATTITVPTVPLTAISGTSLLTCQSNRFVDNSTNNFAITRNGDVKVTPFSPFAPTAAYDASVNGGSGYFDGTGDYLSIADDVDFNVGSGDFTIEGWYYFFNTGSDGTTFFGKWASAPGRNYALIYEKAAGVYRFVYSTNGSNETIVDSSAVSAHINQWVHLAAVRNGTSLKVYLNGAEIISHTISTTTIYNSSTSFMIGRFESNTNRDLNGYCSNFRFVKGTAVYTAAFTPPTSPVSAISGTSLLTNFSNAGIFDNTGKNNLETVADAQIDTTTKKYGTGSMEFDGTGDWLVMPDNPDLQLGTGDFTIEFWVYLATGDTGSNRGLVAKGTSTTGFLVSLNTTEKVVFTFTTSTITSTGAITLDAWNHIAVVREGTGSNETKIYIGGTNDGTGTVSTDFNQTSVMYVGANRTGGDPMKGFIDDLRITKGIARYTAAFTPPAKEFPNL